MKFQGSGYSTSFCDPAQASAYDRFYQLGTADEAIWSLEREFLAEYVHVNRANWPELRYLDFACGTGRVISFMEARVTSSRGIDISPEMLDLARAKVQRSELLCADVTADEDPPDRYDLITAFRFFLNAEPDLRSRVMKALAARLRNQESRLIFSNHGNPISYKAVAWPIHQARQKLFGRRPAGNYLTHSEIRELTNEADLQIVERFGCGLVSPKLFRLAPDTARRVERKLSATRLGRAVGVDQIYVAAKR